MPAASRRLAPLLAAGLGAALVFFLLSRSGMAGKSATYDEAVHLLSGHRILTARDHDFNHEHPPLMKVLAAATVVAAGAARPVEPWTYRREADQWPLSHAWLHHVNDADRLLALGRLPVAVVGAGLAFLVAAAAWGIARGASPVGPEAGSARAPAAAAAVAGAAFALEPNLLAHGSLITTDMGMTAFFFAATAAFGRFLETRAAGWLAATGLLWGIALLAKFTAVLAGPVFLVLGAIHLRFRPREARAAPRRGPAAAPPRPRPWARQVVWGERSGGPWLHLAASVAAAGLIALAVLNAGYGFDSTFRSLSELALESDAFRERARGALGKLPLPVPAPFVQGYDHAEAGGRRWWSYLMGRHSMTGWPHYYLVAFLVKTPIPLLVLAAVGLLAGRRLLGLAPGRIASAAAPPLLLMAAFTLSGSLKNIGLRYVLPVYPFVCVLAGIGGAGLLRARRPYGAVALAALVLWAGAAEARIYPDHLTYFNEIAGGPDGGRWWLLDSNLDWGQDLKGLGTWMKANGVASVFLDYFGRACPRYYGVTAAREFEGGYLAVSATSLAGVYREDKRLYAFLEGVRPIAVIGGSILVYDVPRPPDWMPPPGGVLE
jgi:hypothetical protein